MLYIACGVPSYCQTPDLFSNSSIKYLKWRLNRKNPIRGSVNSDVISKAIIYSGTLKTIYSCGGSGTIKMWQPLSVTNLDYHDRFVVVVVVDLMSYNK
jgi:hypothetical protein